LGYPGFLVCKKKGRKNNKKIVIGNEKYHLPCWTGIIITAVAFALP
jgi:hypothetical protein